MKLYELQGIYENILNLIEDGETTQEEMQQALEQVQDEIEVKADNIAKVIRQLEGDAKTIKAEEERLSNKRKVIENSKDRLKKYLQDAMVQTDNKKFKTELFSFNIAKNPPSLKVDSEENISEEYYKIERKLNKTDLLKAIKNGLEVEGVSIIQGESLRIK